MLSIGLVGARGVPLNRAVDLKSRLAQLLQSHPELALAWAGLLVLMVVALVAMIVTLRGRRLRGELSFNLAPPIVLPASDAMILFFVLSWLMVLPVGAWFFPGVSICGVVWLLRRHGIDPRVQWGSGRLRGVWLLPLAVWIYLVIMGVMLPVSSVVEHLAERFHWDVTPQYAVELLLEGKNPWRLGWLLFLAVVLAPVSEEILFRGFLHPLLKSRLPVMVAWVVTALIFAAIHFHALTFPQLFVVGLVLGAVYEITGSLALCMVVHMCFNLASAMAILAVRWL